MAGFREAYARMRKHYERDCQKHDLADDPQRWADERIEALSIIELLNELEMWASIIDDEVAELEADVEFEAAIGAQP